MGRHLAGFEIEHRGFGIVLVRDVEIAAIRVQVEGLRIADVAEPLDQLLGRHVVECDRVVAAAADDELLAVGGQAQAARTRAGAEGADDLILRVEDRDGAAALVRDEDEAGLGGARADRRPTEDQESQRRKDAASSRHDRLAISLAKAMP